MTDASRISEEVDREVVVNHVRKTYRVPGVTDVADLPTVGEYEPAPDPVDQF